MAQLREDERPLLRFTERVARVQDSHGDYFLLENPLTSRAWGEGPLRRLLADFQLVRADGCAFGLTDVESGMLVKQACAISQQQPADLGAICEDLLERPRASTRSRVTSKAQPGDRILCAGDGWGYR